MAKLQVEQTSWRDTD